MSLNVEIDEFNGPMDLLLKLVEKEKLDIENIDLSQITNKFIEEVEALKNHSTKDLTDFIYLASTLLFIKSKKLLPKNDFDDEDIIDEDILKQRLLEYKKYKEIAQKLFELEKKSNNHFRKVQEDLSIYESETENLIVSDIKLLSEMVINILKKSNDKIIIEETEIMEIDTFKIEDCMEDILWKMKKDRNYEFSDFISKNPSRNEIISLFLAVLELLKSNFITLVSNGSNVNIILR